MVENCREDIGVFIPLSILNYYGYHLSNRLKIHKHTHTHTYLLRYTMAMLHPYPTPLGIFPAFIARQTEMLVIKEKVMSLSGDSFTIKLGNGQPIFQVNGNAFSLSGRKEVLDMSGKHLFTIRKRHFTIHSTYYVEDPAGNEIFEVAGKFSCELRPTPSSPHPL